MVAVLYSFVVVSMRGCSLHIVHWIVRLVRRLCSVVVVVAVVLRSLAVLLRLCPCRCCRVVVLAVRQLECLVVNVWVLEILVVSDCAVVIVLVLVDLVVVGCAVVLVVLFQVVCRRIGLVPSYYLLVLVW